MPTTTRTSREFDQDTSNARKTASLGPVFITDRGQPAHVLLSIEEYRALTGARATLVDLLAMPEVAEVEFEAPRLEGTLARPADLG